MKRKWYTGKKNRLIAAAVVLAIVIASLAVGLSGTFALEPPLVGDFTAAANSYPKVGVGQTLPYVIPGAAYASSSNPAVASVSTPPNGQPLTGALNVTGVSAGVTVVSVGSTMGIVMGMPIQVFDNNNIVKYQIPNAGEVFLSAPGKTAASPVTVETTTNTTSANAAAFNGIQWASLHPKVAEVSASGAVKAIAKGSAIITGVFTDKWGVERTLVVLVVVAKPSSVIDDGKGGFWVPAETPNIYYESDGDGNLNFPPHIVCNPDGPESATASEDVRIGDDGRYYIAKKGYPNIWVVINEITGIPGGDTIWGGPNGLPGGGDDETAVYTSGSDDHYYIDWGQNVYQAVVKTGPRAGLGEIDSQGKNIYYGAGRNFTPGSANNLTRVFLHKDGKFYAGPYTEADGTPYYIGDRPSGEGGDGLLNTNGNGSGGHEATLQNSDEKWYMDENGNMVEEKPASKATVTAVVVSPATVTMQPNTAQQFASQVLGTNNPPQSVIWSVTGSSISGGTAISTTGLLTVAPGETSQTLTVTATSTYDPTKSDSAAVTVTGNYIGKTFEADGYTWLILQRDSKGNLLVTTTTTVGTTEWDENDKNTQYRDSELDEAMRDFYKTLNRMKQYAQPAVFPQEKASGDYRSQSTGWSFVSSGGEKTCFALSVTEIFQSPGFAKYNTANPSSTANDPARAIAGKSWWTRSVKSSDDKESIYYINESGSARGETDYDDVHYGIRPAMWVSEDILH